MLSEWYLRKRYKQGIADGIARAEARRIAEGEARGTAQGSADTQRRWEAWNNRRMTAQAEGQPFNEPPPSPSTPENGSN